jgi:hypothetical protein
MSVISDLPGRYGKRRGRGVSYGGVCAEEIGAAG